MASERRPLRKELLSWDDIDELLVVLLSQLHQTGSFETMVMITRGGIVPGGMIGEALNIKNILTASVKFASELGTKPLAAWPEFLQFPDDALLEGRRVLVVDDVWGSGRTIAAVHGRVQAAKAQSTTATCVFHYNPYRSLFNDAKPDYYGAVTDAHIVYPWEIDRGLEPIPAGTPGYN